MTEQEYKELKPKVRENKILMRSEKDIICEALEKQIPKKPKIVYHDYSILIHGKDRLIELHCPVCGKDIVNMYERDVERGGGLIRGCNGCSDCLQAIDFSEYYRRDGLEDEIDWSDEDGKEQ